MSVLITQPRQQLKFANGNAFQLELRRRVEEYFRTTGRRPRDCWQMYLKTAILLAGFAVSYTLLVFVDQTWWQGLLLAVLLGLLAACWPSSGNFLMISESSSAVASATSRSRARRAGSW